jgi:protein associated with RNAse G/E
MPPRDRRILIHSTKYDGSLHNRFVARLIEVADGVVTVAVDEGTPFEGYRGAGRIHTGFTGLYFTDRWYNVYRNERPTQRSGIVTYANVATPAVLDGDVLRWIDLDLDVMVLRDGTVLLDDEDEFEDHSVRWSYPADIVERARRSSVELLDLARLRRTPFDHAT